MRLSLRDALLIGGLVLLCVGGLWGGNEYQIYRIGQPERLLNSKIGTYHQPEIPPGDTGHLAAAVAGLTAAGIGAGISLFALAVQLLDKRSKRAPEDVMGKLET